LIVRITAPSLSRTMRAWTRSLATEPPSTKVGAGWPSAGPSRGRASRGRGSAAGRRSPQSPPPRSGDSGGACRRSRLWLGWITSPRQPSLPPNRTGGHPAPRSTSSLPRQLRLRRGAGEVVEVRIRGHVAGARTATVRRFVFGRPPAKASSILGCGCLAGRLRSPARRGLELIRHGRILQQSLSLKVLSPHPASENSLVPF
jgi:hypothetical protein